MNSQVNQDENEFLETTQLFLKLLKNPNNQDQILQRFEGYINNGTFLNHMKKIMDQQNDVSLKLKPLIAIIFKELCNKNNNYINTYQQQQNFFEFLLDTINDRNVDFQIKIILADSLLILCDQIEKNQLEFKFLQIITNLMEGNVNYSDFEGPIIISNTIFENFIKHSQGTLTINFINNVFNQQQFKRFLEQLDKLLLDQSLKTPSKISLYIFEKFLMNLIKYLSNDRMFYNIFKNTTFFQDILQIIENIAEPQKFIFRSLYFKVIRLIQKNCLQLDQYDNGCQRKHYFLSQFKEYFYMIYTEYLKKHIQIEIQSENYLKRLLNITIPMINEDQWTNQLKNIIEESFQVIILPNILPTQEELDNPQEFIYYYYDCIDERKSKTQKNLIFALMEELFVKQPDFLEFYIKSLDYLINTSINNLQIDINYLSYQNNNLNTFSVLQKYSNLIKVYLISLTNSAFQIGDRVDLLEIIENTLKTILKAYLSQYQVEDRDEILSLFCLFFTYSSDFIFINNDSFYKSLLHEFVQILNQKQLSCLLELQIYFMFEKIIDEDRIQIFISSEVPVILETMINKIHQIEMQEFYNLLNKLFSFCSTEIIQNVIETFLQQILKLIQSQSNDLILGNCLEVLKSLLNLNFRNNQEGIFLKIDLYIKEFIKIIINNKQNLFKEPLLDIFLIVLKKSKIYLECFQLFQQNLLTVFQNIEAQNTFFQIILFQIRKYPNQFQQKKQEICQLIEIILCNLKSEDVFQDQNILLLGYLFSLGLFNQDQTVRLFNICFKLLVSKSQQKQTIQIAACVFLKIAQMNQKGVENFLQQNNVSIQSFFQQLVVIFIDKIKPPLYFLNNWMNINIQYIKENFQQITKNQFQNFLINCLLLNLIQLNQANLFLEEKDQILFILKEQFSNDSLYQQLTQAYNLDYDYDDLSGIEDEKLKELEDIGANLGKFPDHTLQNLTSELLSLNNRNSFDSFEEMRKIIIELEKQQDYQEIYNMNLDERFQKLIRSTKNLYTFTKNGEYSVRKILKLKRKNNNQFQYINQPKDGKGSLSPMERNFIIIYIFQYLYQNMAETKIDLIYLQKNVYPILENSINEVYQQVC